MSVVLNPVTLHVWAVPNFSWGHAWVREYMWFWRTFACLPARSTDLSENEGLLEVNNTGVWTEERRDVWHLGQVQTNSHLFITGKRNSSCHQWRDQKLSEHFYEDWLRTAIIPTVVKFDVWKTMKNLCLQTDCFISKSIFCCSKSRQISLIVPVWMGFSTRLGISMAFLDLSAWWRNKTTLLSKSNS